MPRSLSEFANDLRRLPRVVSHRIAEEAAPKLTEISRQTFEASETPYGVPWVPGAEGQRVTLNKTGALFRYIRYVAIGTKLRIALGVPYAKYQIGKRQVFPRQNGALPPEYAQALQRIAVRVVKEALR